MSVPFWVEPRIIDDINECYFYHTMDIPGHGLVKGNWDLRGKESEYLGHVDFQGKRVLEIGTASGHLCFSMEKMGAEVVAYDLSPKQDWDLVPYSGLDLQAYKSDRKTQIQKLNNGYWFAHKAFDSRAKVLYGTVYEIPADAGQFDIATFGCVLLHLRDPFLALQCVSAHVTDTIIVTDLAPNEGDPMIRFLPNAATRAQPESWWAISPELVSEYLQILGFEQINISFHQQKFEQETRHLFTVIGERNSSL